MSRALFIDPCKEFVEKLASDAKQERKAVDFTSTLCRTNVAQCNILLVYFRYQLQSVAKQFRYLKPIVLHVAKLSAYSLQFLLLCGLVYVTQAEPETDTSMHIYSTLTTI